MKDPRDIIIRPIITEKGTEFIAKGEYAFEVATFANKPQIKKAVEELFKIHTINVNTITVKGKKRGIGRFKGKRKNWKKAIVTLREGDSIPLFEGV
ncbi:MAG: 50S ribosomal protein L23 [candidate division WOR-3 bacterium]|nr:50S ribosomal protein L23 [candidate division WOR-3 bacterium]